MNISCWHCPYGFLPNEKCLNDPEDFGHAQTCRLGFDNACESLVIGNENISSCYFEIICVNLKVNRIYHYSER